MERREFLKVCASFASLTLLSPYLLKESFASQSNEFKRYEKALLVKKDGTPLKPEDIKVGKQYIFFYPYASTPAFLINLGKEVNPVEVSLSNGSKYLWPGGVGPQKSIVAFCAICPHQLLHPTPDYSLINYYPPDKVSGVAKRGNVIQCCGHLSVYDPEKGGVVISGPAEYPLLTIVLSYEDEKLYAVGTLGKEFFTEFFDTFSDDLRNLYKSLAEAKKMVDKAVVLELEEYTKQLISC